MNVLLGALADAVKMGVGFFFGMLFMREQYMRVMEQRAGGSFKNEGKCG